LLKSLGCDIIKTTKRKEDEIMMNPLSHLQANPIAQTIVQNLTEGLAPLNLEEADLQAVICNLIAARVFKVHNLTDLGDRSPFRGWTPRKVFVVNNLIVALAFPRQEVDLCEEPCFDDEDCNDECCGDEDCSEEVQTREVLPPAVALIPLGDTLLTSRVKKRLLQQELAFTEETLEILNTHSPVVKF